MRLTKGFTPSFLLSRYSCAGWHLFTVQSGIKNTYIVKVPLTVFLRGESFWLLQTFEKNTYRGS